MSAIIDKKEHFSEVELDKKKSIILDLKERYNVALLDKIQTARYLDISVPTLNKRICEGKDLPNYSRLTEHKNQKIFFHINDIADFIVKKTIKTFY